MKLTALIKQREGNKEILNEIPVPHSIRCRLLNKL